MTQSSSLSADLVLEGGGVLGIGHVGAISVLENAGYSFPRVAGTSRRLDCGGPGGCGHAVVADRGDQVDGELSPVRRSGTSGPGSPRRSLLSLLMDNGVFEGDHLREWLGNLLVDECGVETFGDLAIDARAPPCRPSAASVWSSPPPT